MTSRRESAVSVSLFPFLAVLVCAMGALILLLLVMTRSIRKQAELRAQYEAVAAAAKTAPVTAPSPAPTRRPSPPKRTSRAAKTPAWTAPPPPQVITPPPKPIYIDPTYETRRTAQLRQHDADQRTLQRKWEQNVARLAAEQAEAAEAAERLRRTLTDRRQELQQSARAIADEEQRLARLESGPPTSAADLARLAERRDAVQQEIEAVAQQLKTLQAERKRGDGERFTVVPFDAATGTTRRPIVIECTRDRMVLVSEGITLMPNDLNGFVPHYNPLAAGVETLIEGFSRRDSGQTPYILLIVRPDGTITYYIARMLLQALDVPFGYELVGGDQKFTWSETDAPLVKQCRDSIDEVLREQPRVAELMRFSGHKEEPLAVRGSGGEFRLEEVDRMRQPGRNVQFGGQRIDRNQYSSSSPGNGTNGGEQRGGFLRRGGSGANSQAGGASGSSPGAADNDPAGFRRQPTAGGGDSEPAPLGPQSSERGTASTSGGRGGGASSPQRGGRPAPGGGSADDPFRWKPRLGSGVGILRDVKIRISNDTIAVDGEDPIDITAVSDMQSLSRLLSVELDRLLEEWGPAPKGFYWNPRLEILVAPGGAPAAGKLSAAAREWGVDSHSQFLSESAPPAPTVAPERLGAESDAVRRSTIR